MLFFSTSRICPPRNIRGGRNSFGFGFSLTKKRMMSSRSPYNLSQFAIEINHLTFLLFCCRRLRIFKTEREWRFKNIRQISFEFCDGFSGGVNFFD